MGQLLGSDLWFQVLVNLIWVFLYAWGLGSHCICLIRLFMLTMCFVETTRFYSGSLESEWMGSVMQALMPIWVTLNKPPRNQGLVVLPLFVALKRCCHTSWLGELSVSCGIPLWRDKWNLVLCFFWYLFCLMYLSFCWFTLYPFTVMYCDHEHNNGWVLWVLLANHGSWEWSLGLQV